MSRVWSDQQNRIFEWFATGRGNLCVRARAGTGKTTTIIEATARAPEQAQLVAAFNRRIAQELERKIRDVGGRAEAKTLHGIGYSVVTRYWERAQLDPRRGYDLAKRAAGDQAPDEMIKKAQKLAGIAKGCLAPMMRDMPRLDGFDNEERVTEHLGARGELLDALEGLAIQFDLEPDPEWQKDGWTTVKLCGIVAQAMELARHRPEGDTPPTLDYDDMIYLPVANGWARPRYDLVVIDEAQDMNATQLALAMAVVTPQGRVAVVGDDRQAIYGFRGADSSALDRLKLELGATELGLTTTYRCGRAIVALAKKLVPDFEAGPDNPPGEVVEIDAKEMLDLARAGDFILSRKNAPLAAYCLKLIRAGKAARIEGKDVAAGLKAIVRRWKPRNLQALVDNIERWRDREIEKLTPKAGRPEADERISVIRDQAEILLALCDGLANPMELMTRLDTMFGDSEEDRRPMIVCSSIHRSKGLEAERVFILQNTLYPQTKVFIARDKMNPVEAASRAHAITEEANLEYVAYTRAKNTLFMVDE